VQSAEVRIMKSRLANGLVLGFVLAVSSTWARLGDRLASPGVPLSQTVAAAAPQTDTIAQRFICTSGYNMERCIMEMAVLRKVLAKYPVAGLGEWTWVLIRSEDWKSVVLPRGISPDCPAFTSIERRETFIEQALVTEVPGRRGELMKTWRMNMEDLLDFAIAHELAHILCNEKDEGDANHAARMLLERKQIACKSKLASKAGSKRMGQKR
jgi:hypothetical protein